MDEDKLKTLLKYVKDQKTEAETLARDLNTQRANKDQKARTEKDPIKSKRLLYEASELRRRCFRDPEEKLRNLRSRIAQEFGLKETREIDARASKATNDNLEGENWARRVLGMTSIAGVTLLPGKEAKPRTP
jgi:GAF domain-containing protein